MDLQAIIHGGDCMNGLFESPLVLVLAVFALPAALYVLRRFARIREQLSFAGGNDLPGERLAVAVLLRTVFFSVAWVLLIIAAAGPRWGIRLEQVREQGSAVVFALDISRSMTVSDIPPDRLSYAARYAARLAGELDGIPCALVLFKGDAFLSLPLTTDRRALMDALHSVSPAMLTVTGSSPDRALRTAVKAFPAALSVSRYIVLLSDGEQTSGSITDAAGELKKQDITLFAVGVGTVDGMELDVFPDPENTRMHLSRLNPVILEQAADAAGGSSRFVIATSPGSGSSIVEEIKSSTEQGRKNMLAPRTVKRYPAFLAGAILAFCAALVSGGVSWKKS